MPNWSAWFFPKESSPEAQFFDMETSGAHNWLKHWDFILIDLVVLALSFAGAYLLRFGNFGFLQSTSWQRLLVIILLLNLVITLVTNPYSGVFRRPYYEDAIKMFLLAVYSFICASVFFYLFKMGQSYSRLMLVGMYLIYFVLSFTFKAIRKKAMLSGKRRSASLERRNIVVLTRAGGAEEALELINSSDYLEYQVVAFCFADDAESSRADDAGPSSAGSAASPRADKAASLKAGDDAKSPSGELYAGLPVVPFAGLVDFALHNHIDGIFIAVNPALISKQDYETLVVNEITPHVSIENLVGIQTDVQSVEHVGVYKTLSIGKYSFDSSQAVYLVVKRIFDILLGLVGCVLLVPVVLLVKLAYLLSGDTSPIFYAQDRVGYRGRPFKLYKLRSMVPDADEVLARLLEDPANRVEWEESQKLANDPRITPIGRFLRKTSLDEFPQFVNVVKGEMSIVGPRPLLAGELDEHGGLSLYHKVRPGITGWWACNGRSNISYRERLELEYHYVRHCSLYLDVLCVLRTFFAVFRREGAV